MAIQLMETKETEHIIKLNLRLCQLLYCNMKINRLFSKHGKYRIRLITITFCNILSNSLFPSVLLNRYHQQVETFLVLLLEQLEHQSDF